MSQLLLNVIFKESRDKQRLSKYFHHKLMVKSLSMAQEPGDFS